MPGPVMNIDSVQVTRELHHGDRFGRYVREAESLGYWDGE